MRRTRIVVRMPAMRRRHPSRASSALIPNLYPVGLLSNMSRLSQTACGIRLKQTSPSGDSRLVEQSPETPLLNDYAFDESYLVTLMNEGDRNNARNWRLLDKSWLTCMLGMLALSASLGSSIIARVQEDTGRHLGIGEQQTILVVSLYYVLGFAPGPLLWAPVCRHSSFAN